ncbi:ABC transporter ATP-binding protein [Clostridium guangxiense]|uniref:ABC transporter ATP-binding protein n=1 Tax=Clostridium guangxiense TaxID=1662055 RepID=UPI001E386616|nr:ABC transporter ATP-binding protein [Clostridium guangxiense]MCD2346312.1 ABC transporter ATP-binding protein/permease [Clostridium guangxiense]
MARNKFDEDEDFEEKINSNDLKRLLKYVVPYKKEMIITVFLMLLSSAATLLGPYLVQIAIDDMIPKKNIRGLVMLSAIFVLTIIITGLCMKFKIRTMSDIGQKVIRNIRSDIFNKLQELPFSYYDDRPHGKILVRVVNYVNSLSDLLSNGLINLITDLFTAVVIIVFMFAINVKLTLLCFAGFPVLILAIFIIKNAQRKAFRAYSNKQSNLNAYIHESITGIKVTQAFVRENENLGIFRKVSNDFKKSWLKAVSVQLLLGPCIDNISVATISLIYLVGIYSIGKGITIGVLVAFVGYISRFWGPITNIGNFYNTLIMNMAYVERIFETIDEKVTVKDIEGAKKMPLINGNVEFKNVVFKYDESATILKNVSFKVNAGETIAIVGPTGAGKTTIINLLSRFYDISGGEVLIDGVNVHDVTIKSLRKQMGVMLQDTFVFSGTIMDNIRYGKLDATDEEVIEAAKTVRAHDFIKNMKNGYYTEVNERGSRLSVGQRQLISFARALLANPRILILDEATSSIDTKTELALQEGLNRLLKGRTSFIIAHRLSTIKNANKIMYVDKGRIVEEGNHDELMRKKGEYYELYMSQYNILKAV